MEPYRKLLSTCIYTSNIFKNSVYYSMGTVNYMYMFPLNPLFDAFVGYYIPGTRNKDIAFPLATYCLARAFLLCYLNSDYQIITIRKPLGGFGLIKK
jgi:hypothetical protein